MFLANVVFLVFGLVGARLFSRISLIPRTFLWPTVFALCVVGAYGVNQSMVDVMIMLIAGFAGFWLKRYGFGAAPIIMGVVLGSLVENSLAQSMIIFDHDAWRFLDRPIAIGFFLLAAFSLFYQPVFGWLRRFRRPRSAASKGAK